MAGRKPEWSEEVRAAVTAAVLDQGIPLNRVINYVNAGQLEGFAATPVPYSTARRWIDMERTKRAREMPADIAAWNAAAERLWLVVGGELRKLERDAKGARFLDPKRLREMIGLLREAKSLIAVQHSTPDPETEGDSEGEEATTGFLSTLPDPDAPKPTQHQREGNTESGSKGASDSSASSEERRGGAVLTRAG